MLYVRPTCGCGELLQKTQYGRGSFKTVVSAFVVAGVLLTGVSRKAIEV
jgi:hypothetical protein